MSREIRAEDKSHELSIAMFGEDMLVTGVDKPKDPKQTAYIHLTSTRDDAVCPTCGHVGELIKGGGGFTRTVQSLPILQPGQPVELKISGRQSRCTNPECKRYGRGYREQFDTVGRYQRRTIMTTVLIFSLSVMMSCSGASLMLALLGIFVSADTIMNIFSRIDIKDDPNVTRIGVDDVANRKGLTYFTAIYAIDDHRCLALLPGRDGKAFEKWLLEHVKVELVCRDRASAYATAIRRVCAAQGRSIDQVADRFHLLQNCIEHLRDELYREIPLRVAFLIGTKTLLSKIPAKQISARQILTSEQMAGFNYDNTPIVLEDGTVCEFAVQSSYQNSKAKENADQKREAKYLMIKEIREAFDPDKPASPQYKELADRHGVTTQTVKRYLEMSEELEATCRPKQVAKEKEIDSYKYIIYRMLVDGKSTIEIFSYVKSKGYSGCDQGLKAYIDQIRRDQCPELPPPPPDDAFKAEYPEGVIVFTRTQIFRALVSVHESPFTKEIKPYLPIILEKYPKCQLVQTIFHDFHSIIMGDDPDKIDTFIDTYKDSCISGFCTSMGQDITPIKNAISRPESSGFVEGNNHKFKLLKRILYGRCGLVNLEIRTKLAFMVTLEDFGLAEIFP